METESQIKPIIRNKAYLNYEDALSGYLSQVLVGDQKQYYQQMLKNLDSLKKEAWAPSSDKEQVDRDNRLYNNYYDKVVAFEKKHGIIDFCKNYWRKNKK